MKRFYFVGLICIFVVAGCNSPSATTENSTDSPPSGTHVHADGTTHTDHSVSGHAHGPGPHDGTIVDWGGGKMHVEFTVDHDQQQSIVYVFGSDEKTPTAIDSADITLSIKDPRLTTSLKASPQDGDPEGKSSRFIGNHEGLGVVKEFEGSISGVVDGTPYSGNFKEESHDH